MEENFVSLPKISLKKSQKKVDNINTKKTAISTYSNNKRSKNSLSHV